MGDSMSCIAGSFTKNCNLPDIPRGDDVIIPLLFVDTDESVIDVSGDIVTITFKSDYSFEDSEAELQYIMNVGNTTDTQAGIVDIPLSSVLTTIDIREYSYDIQWKRVASGSGGVHTAYLGTVNIIRDITTT